MNPTIVEKIHELERINQNTDKPEYWRIEGRYIQVGIDEVTYMWPSGYYTVKKKWRTIFLSTELLQRKREQAQAQLDDIPF